MDIFCWFSTRVRVFTLLILYSSRLWTFFQNFLSQLPSPYYIYSHSNSLSSTFFSPACLATPLPSHEKKDSFRWTEALEFGCIPIVEDDDFHDQPICDNHRACRHNQPHYFRNLLNSTPPFPRVVSWAQAPALLNSLLSQPSALAHLQGTCLEWYEKEKARIAHIVAHRLAV